jgi:heme/copper-type cytochrome/quinol oxidase subunit 1
MDKRGASISERLRIAKSVELSRGVFTIEWALPSPPPEHTFEELPIIKELPDVAPDEKSVKPKH